jgi:CHAT domain-containing protein
LWIDLLMQSAGETDDPAERAARVAEAFHVQERARARTLLDLLRTTGPAGDEPRDERERALQAEVNRLAALETDEKGPQGVALRAALSDLDRLRGQPLADEHAAVPRPLTAAAVRRLLDADTALLAYRLGDEGSHLWWVTRNEVRGFALPPRETIETAARRAHFLLARGHRREARAATARALCELSHLALAPLVSELRQRRLVVVADGALALVPFAVLPTPAASPPSVAQCNDEPLVVHHEIVTLPSASVLAALRSRRQPAGAGALAISVTAVADPVFSSSDPRLAAATATSQAGADGTALPRLPFSHQEAAAVLALARQAGGDGRLLTGFGATKGAILAGALRDRQVVHFATHAVIDDAHPELSRIALSRFAADGAPLDGDLRAHELYRLSLNADLITLSGCRTALGAHFRGEGWVGMSHALFHAGAGALLVSLWELDDRATARFMERFYRRLLAGGEPPAAALRAAQLETLHDEPAVPPRDWAAFVLQGDWQ